MSLDQIISKPWSSESLSNAYKASYLHLSPAPEYANGEVVLASLYRSVGSNCPREQQVPALGREFERRVKKGKRPIENDEVVDLEVSDWYALITGALRSPKQPNQASSRFLQISPVVPDATLYSLSARQSKNSWDPGRLVEKIILIGCDSYHEATELWNELHRSLSVSENDELWARFLDAEFRRW